MAVVNLQDNTFSPSHVLMQVPAQAIQAAASLQGATLVSPVGYDPNLNSVNNVQFNRPQQSPANSNFRQNVPASPANSGYRGSNAGQQANANGANPPPSPANKMKSSKPRPVCLDWLQGKCNTKRWSCKFAHPQLPSMQEGANTQPPSPAAMGHLTVTVGQQPQAPPLQCPPCPMPMVFSPPMSPHPISVGQGSMSPSPHNGSIGPLSPQGSTSPQGPLSPQNYANLPMGLQPMQPTMLLQTPVPNITPAAPQAGGGICPVWELTGTCKFGDFCRDFHPALDVRVPRVCLNPRDNPFSQKAAQARDLLKMQQEGDGTGTPGSSAPPTPSNLNHVQIVVGRNPPASHAQQRDGATTVCADIASMPVEGSEPHVAIPQIAQC